MSEDLNIGVGPNLEDMPDDVWYGTKEVSSPVVDGDDGDDLPPDDAVYVDPRVDPEIGRKLALYDSKNEYLSKNPLFREIDKLAVRLQELEQAQKKLRRTAINNFRLTCKVGIEAGVLPENAVKEALKGVEE